MKFRPAVPLQNLSRMEYPGRAIIIGLDEDGDSAIVVYVLTGRSDSSRARRLILQGNTIWTEPTDEKLIVKGNPELLIYPAVIKDGGIAVGNGRQTADVGEELKRGKNPETILELALRDWVYEPDFPIFTPRISGCILPGRRAALSIIKRGRQGSPQRRVYGFSLRAGQGKMISTYSGENKEPLRPFAGRPRDVGLPGKTASETAGTVYDALAPRREGQDFRVAVACLFARGTELGEVEISILNRQEREGYLHGQSG